MTANPTLTVGNYALVDRFAIGGTAEVYRAQDLKTKEWVVIKRLRPDLPFDPEVSGGFLREIQLALLSKHHNLVRGLSHGTHDGLEYVVLEYVQGSDLEQLWRRSIQARVDVPTSFWMYILREVLCGLEFAHALCDASGDSVMAAGDHLWVAAGASSQWTSRDDTGAADGGCQFDANGSPNVVQIVNPTFVNI